MFDLLLGSLDGHITVTVREVRLGQVRWGYKDYCCLKCDLLQLPVSFLWPWHEFPSRNCDFTTLSYYSFGTYKYMYVSVLQVSLLQVGFLHVRLLQVSLLQGGILQVRLFTTMPLTSQDSTTWSFTRKALTSKDRRGEYLYDEQSYKYLPLLSFSSFLWK